VRLLLDTHTMYWYIEDDAQLSGRARTLIQDASNEIVTDRECRLASRCVRRNSALVSSH
jgi:hypothetical protein